MGSSQHSDVNRSRCWVEMEIVSQPYGQARPCTAPSFPHFTNFRLHPFLHPFAISITTSTSPTHHHLTTTKTTPSKWPTTTPRYVSPARELRCHAQMLLPDPARDNQQSLKPNPVCRLLNMLTTLSYSTSSTLSSPPMPVPPPPTPCSALP